MSGPPYHRAGDGPPAGDPLLREKTQQRLCPKAARALRTVPQRVRSAGRSGPPLFWLLSPLAPPPRAVGQEKRLEKSRHVTNPCHRRLAFPPEFPVC